MSQPRTYYGDRAPSVPTRNPLEGHVDAQVCVVGGGLAGLSTALELARAGRSVTVLESEQVGFGASGRNGGFVGPAWSQGLDALVRKVGLEPAKELYRLSQEGVEVVRQNIAALEMPGVDPVKGKLSVARTPSREAFLKRRDRLQREFGQSVEIWETEQVRAVLDTPRYFQALFMPDDFQIDPLAYARGLAVEIERLGGRVYERSPVIEIGRRHGGRTVHTAMATVKADDVVIASGGYTGRLHCGLARAFVPIATYVMITRAEPELIATAVRTPYAVGDQRRAGDYYRLVEGETRILWGGRITTRKSEPSRLAQMLRATMVSTFPQLAGLKVDYAWSGLMSYARHLMPQIGPLEEGLWSCTAFGGHGLNTTAIGGKVVAEAILKKGDRWRLFTPFGLDWTGGPVGPVAVQAQYWWLQARDLLTEAMPAGHDQSA